MVYIKSSYVGYIIMSIEKRFLRIVSEQVNEEVTDISQTIVEVGLDSLGVIEVIFEVEDQFDIELNEMDFNLIDTLAEFLNLIEEQL